MSHTSQRLTSSKAYGRQILWSVFLSLLLLISYFLWTNYTSALQKSERLVYERLEAIVKSGVSFINGDEHELIVNKYRKRDQLSESQADSVYWKIHQQLKKLQEKNRLNSPVYTLVFSQDQEEFEFVVTSAEVPYFRHAYYQYPQTLRSDFEKGGVLGLHQSENGKWLSAFAPIRNSQGKVVAVLQADQRFDEYMAEARMNLLGNLMVSLILSAAVVYLVLIFIRRILKKEQHFLDDILERNQEILSQKEEIEAQNNFIQENNLKLEFATKEIEAKNKELKMINQMLEMRVEQRTLDLQRANNDLSAFLYRSSHDIMGPIASLKGLHQLAKVEIKDDTSMQLFGQAESSVAKLEKQVKNISRVYEIKKKELELKEFNLEDLIKSICAEQQGLLSGKCSFHFDFHKTDSVVADKQILSYAIEELIKNGLKYGKSEVWLHLEERAGHAVLTISDKGEGFHERIYHQVLELFRSSEAITEMPVLGLYLVKSAMDRLKGKVKLFQREGFSASVQLFIPERQSLSLP